MCAEHILSFLKGRYDSSCSPKPMWPSRRSRVAPSRRKILLDSLIPPKTLYFCDMMPIRIQEYDSLFSWGIEAVWSDGTVSPIPIRNYDHSHLIGSVLFPSRPISEYLSGLTENQTENELLFGTNSLNKHPDSLDSLIGIPDPRFSFLQHYARHHAGLPREWCC